MSETETAEAGETIPVEDVPILIEGFLQARGYELFAPRPGLLLGRPLPDAAQPPTAVLLAGAEGASLDWALEAAATARAEGVEGRIALVAPSMEGLRAEPARARLREARIREMYPLQFLDEFFTTWSDAGEDDPAIARTLREVLDENRLSVRAPQPYRRLSGLAPSGFDAPPDGPDLLAPLRTELLQFPDAPMLRVIGGAAGVGKTALVAELCDTVQRKFNAAKQRRLGLARRPLLFEPKTLGSHEIGAMPDSVEALIRRLFHTGAADRADAPETPPAALHWLCEQGFSTWVFDGLDEFIRSDTDFFRMLEEKLRDPEGRAQIVICTRDSLFSSSPELIGFLERLLAEAPDRVALYELTRWDREAKRAFIEASLIHDGVKDAALERRTNEVLGAIEADTALAELTDLPFYCATFVSALQDGRAQDLSDEFDLLQFAVDALVERERGKLAIEWDVFVSAEEVETVRRWAADAEARGLGGRGENLFADALQAYGQDNLEYTIGAAAFLYRFAGPDGRALDQISIDDWRHVLSPTFLDPDQPAEVQEQVRLALMQFAFFSRGGESHSMGFTHDLIGDYLAAKYAFKLIADGPARPEAWKQAIGQRPDVAETVLFRYLAARVAADPEIVATARRLAAGEVLEPRIRRIVEQLLAAA